MLDKWRLNKCGSLEIYQDMLLIETGVVQQGFSTRWGGVSTGAYAALNLALHVGDQPEVVDKNRSLLSESLGVNQGEWVTLSQVHSDKIYKVSLKDEEKSFSRITGELDEGDGLITNQTGVPLVTFYADCISLFIVDEKQQALGLAHAGWKGTLHEIGPKTLALMNREFGTIPANCKVAIGPGIDWCCYQVGQPVYLQFREKFSFWQQAVYQGIDKSKWQLSLKLVNWLQLVKCGVNKEKISVSSLCTRCNQHLFFSYRGAVDGITGRMAALLMLS